MANPTSTTCQPTSVSRWLPRRGAPWWWTIAAPARALPSEDIAFAITASNVTPDEAPASNQVTGSFSTTTSIDYGGAIIEDSFSSLTVKGGSNDGNTFRVGDGNHNLDYVPANVSIQGGNRGDSLTVDDRGTADPAFPSVISDLPIFTITAGNVTRVDQAGAVVPPSTVAVGTYFTSTIDYNSIGNSDGRGWERPSEPGSSPATRSTTSTTCRPR